MHKLKKENVKRIGNDKVRDRYVVERTRGGKMGEHSKVKLIKSRIT